MSVSKGVPLRNIQAVIFDWAGTSVDFGSCAPTAVFRRLFEKRSIAIRDEQIRAPMGLMKKDHLRALLVLPEITEQWQQRFGHPAGDEDLETLYNEFVPLQIECIRDYAQPIPGTLPLTAELRRQGIKIGSTTGYTRAMMDVLVPAAQAFGYAPDTWVCPDDVPAGRPYPWMCFLNAIRLEVYPLDTIVKIGDTLTDIQEGLNAGMWTIGLALSGNMLGLSEQEFKTQSPEALQPLRQEIADRFVKAGAHIVCEGAWDCLPALNLIDARIAEGQKP